MAAEHYGRVSETPCFPGEIHRRSLQIATYYGDSKFSTIASLPAIYGSLEALRAENCKKVSKKSSRAFRSGVSKKSRKGRKVPQMRLFGDFSGTFRPSRDFFETPGRKAQEDFLETFSRFSARRASRLPQMADRDAILHQSIFGTAGSFGWGA